jgi:hypothetical protein
VHARLDTALTLPVIPAVIAGDECGVANLADDVVEIAEGGADALPDGVRGQVRGGLQAEPGAEQAGDDRIEQLQVGLDSSGPVNTPATLRKRAGAGARRR